MEPQIKNHFLEIQQQNIVDIKNWSKYLIILVEKINNGVLGFVDRPPEQEKKFKTNHEYQKSKNFKENKKEFK